MISIKTVLSVVFNIHHYVLRQNGSNVSHWDVQGGLYMHDDDEDHTRSTFIFDQARSFLGLPLTTLPTPELLPGVDWRNQLDHIDSIPLPTFPRDDDGRTTNAMEAVLTALEDDSGKREDITPSAPPAPRYPYDTFEEWHQACVVGTHNELANPCAEAFIGISGRSRTLLDGLRSIFGGNLISPKTFVDMAYQLANASRPTSWKELWAMLAFSSTFIHGADSGRVIVVCELAAARIMYPEYYH
jgi:hypothetical protein